MKDQPTTSNWCAPSRFLRATFIGGLLPVLALLLSIQSSHAGSASWLATPATGDWTVSLPATIITFDAPDAGTSPGQGTFSRKTNEAGLITGQYIDANGPVHSFLRTADGAITEFDPPGAITSEGLSINSAGTVAGLYDTLNDMIKVVRGYMRTLDGTSTEFDAPGAGTQGGDQADG